MAEPPRLVLLGASGHAKVVVDLLRADPRGFDLVGATDLDPRLRTVAGLTVLGDDSKLDDLFRDGVTLAFVALGDNATRARAAAHILQLGFDAPRAISARATVSPSAVVGRGAAVMAGSVINAEAEVGAFAIVNSGAVVEHDCRVAAFAHLGPHSTLTGGVTVGARTLIGAGATVLPGITIGADVIIGAGACVTGDVPDGAVMVGAPARPRPADKDGATHAV